MLFLAATAAALTLDEAVRKAAEVDALSLIAEADAQISRLQATEAWTPLTLTPTLSGSRTWRGGASSEVWQVGVSSGVLDVGQWFDALQKRADAKSAAYTAEAATLDAEYVAATLYMTVVAADAALIAATHGQAVAEATLKATDARVGAGLESELAARSARISLLRARTDVENARVGAEVSRIALARVLHLDGADLVVDPPPPLTVGALTVADSPVVKAARAAREAAGYGHGQRIAEFFPTGSISASSALSPMSWGVTVGFTWSFDGIVGPVLREREARQDERIAALQVDEAVRDAEAAVATGLAQARASARVAELAREREQLAEDALKVGQARLVAGIGTSLEVLRLQDDATVARAERIAAELDAAASTLSARQAAGVPWGAP